MLDVLGLGTSSLGRLVEKEDVCCALEGEVRACVRDNDINERR